MCVRVCSRAVQHPSVWLCIRCVTELYYVYMCDDVYQVYSVNILQVYVC